MTQTKIVPIEPDIAMMQAALEASRKVNPDTPSGRPLPVGFEYEASKHIYKAMIEAAPTVESEPYGYVRMENVELGKVIKGQWLNKEKVEDDDVAVYTHSSLRSRLVPGICVR